MYIVDPFKNSNSMINYDLYNSELLIIPMTCVNIPRIGNNIYFSNYESLNGKNVVGITYIDNNILNPLNINNVSYNNLSMVRLRQLTISIYDYNKENYSIDNLPLTSLISPSELSTDQPMKYPYFNLDIHANFKKSFITVNGVNTFVPGTKYAICLNVYYK
jgi:hypothetical protein